MKSKFIIPFITIVIIAAGIVWLISRPRGSNEQKTANTIRSASPVPGTSIGDLAPQFSVMDVISEKTVTNNDLSAKPFIVWFTATYCVPCQIGAAEVQRLDDDLGGKAFNVVMVFVDPKETKMDLQLWKAQFANDDWIVAFGNEQLVQEYRIRFLDTQYLVDGDGVVTNVANSFVGYERYKSKINPLL